MNTTSIKFFYNGIKLNGENKLVKCSYSIDNARGLSDPCVTIYARGYDDLPRDLFPVVNNSDPYTDYFDSDHATITADHPLYPYARAAALKFEINSVKRSLQYAEKRAASGGYMSDYYAKEAADQRQRLTRYAAELEQLPAGHPTAADLAKIEAQRVAAENARREQEHAQQLAAREKAIRDRNEARAYIEAVEQAHPITPGAPVVVVEWSENSAFANGQRFSVAATEILFKHFDEQAAAGDCGYEKTSFIIEYTDENGEPSTYKGRYDFGDNEGGLIAHIRSYGEFLRDKGNFGNGKPSDEDKETGAALVAFAAMLEEHTDGGRVVSVELAPYVVDFTRYKAEQQAKKKQEDAASMAETIAMLQMLTDDQLERAVFTISPHDKENADVARFFLQELADRDRPRALKAFQRWKSKS